MIEIYTHELGSEHTQDLLLALVSRPSFFRYPYAKQKFPDVVFAVAPTAAVMVPVIIITAALERIVVSVSTISFLAV
jgi:hypothetical protein